MSQMYTDSMVQLDKARDASLLNIMRSRQAAASVTQESMPPGVQLISVDKGIVHCQIKQNGMKIAIVPCGQTSSLMLHRIVIGGSRLEDRSSAGLAHLLEHLDHRLLDWNSVGGSNTNASTCKTNIQHMIQTIPSNLANGLNFNYQTMRGLNLDIATGDLQHESHNVASEGQFNAQKGSMPRNLIMKQEELLLQRLWPEAWVKPTIGLKNGEDLNVTDAAAIKAFHRTIRCPSRTTMVLAGPVDAEASIKLLDHVFKDVPRSTSLKAIPAVRAPTSKGFLAGNVSSNSHSRGISIGYLAPPYGMDSLTLGVMPHLVGMMGKSNPVFKNNGLTDVGMYFNPSKDGSVVIFFAKVKVDHRSEEEALTAAQQVLHDNIVVPLKVFDADPMLTQVKAMLNGYMAESILSGPSQAAALAITGIEASDMPSLAWHHNELYENVSSSSIRKVATNLFNTQQMAVVRYTESDGSVGLAKPLEQIKVPRPGGSVQLVREPDNSAYLSTARCIQLRQDTKPYWVKATEPRYLEKPPKFVTSVRGASRLSYANNIMPTSKKYLMAMFGEVSDYGGWPSAALVVAAMNELAKSTGASGVSFKIEQNAVVGTVSRSNGAPPSSVPMHLELARVVAAADAMLHGTPQMRQVAQSLSFAALQGALDESSKQYDSVSFQAEALARSKVCNTTDNGYRPSSMQNAHAQLCERFKNVTELLQVAVTAPPKVTGVNVAMSNVQACASALSTLNKCGSHADVRFLSRLPSNVNTHTQAAVPGLLTYPCVSTSKSGVALRDTEKMDRAALILSNKIMVGGMGSVYMHQIREHGLSYRPSGSIRLSWSAQPIITLNATFDHDDQRKGTAMTSAILQDWKTGKKYFTLENVRQARRAIVEQLAISAYDIDALKYEGLSTLSQSRLGVDGLLEQCRLIEKKVETDSSYMPSIMQKYFGSKARDSFSIVVPQAHSLINEADVRADVQKW